MNRSAEFDAAQEDLRNAEADLRAATEESEAEEMRAKALSLRKEAAAVRQRTADRRAAIAMAAHFAAERIILGTDIATDTDTVKGAG